MELGTSRIFETETLLASTMAQILRITRDQRMAPEIRQQAENILRGVPEKNWDLEIRAVWNWIKSHVRYTRDVHDVEYIQTPSRHIHNIRTNGQSQGDCDDMSLLAGTLLESAGYKIRYVVVRTPGNPPGAFNHIYVEVLNPKSRMWLGVDCTMKDQAFGWKPPFVEKREYTL